MFMPGTDRSTCFGKSAKSKAVIRAPLGDMSFNIPDRKPVGFSGFSSIYSKERYRLWRLPFAVFNRFQIIRVSGQAPIIPAANYHTWRRLWPNPLGTVNIRFLFVTIFPVCTDRLFTIFAPANLCGLSGDQNVGQGPGGIEKHIFLGD
jgi:hypothetical protein